MDEFIYIGKIVNTHGIKGEVRILSDFERKDKVFIKGMNIYIGKKKEKEIINSYRHHKNFEMITIIGYTDINQVLKYKGLNVYIKKSDLNLDNGEYLDSDLIGLDVIVDGLVKGKVTDIINLNGNKLIVIDSFSNKVYVPYQKEFISIIDFTNRKIMITPIKGMF